MTAATPSAAQANLAQASLPPLSTDPFAGLPTAPLSPDGLAAPTLQDAELDAFATPGSTPGGAPLAPAPPPMTNDQIIGLVAQLSSFGLPPELAAAFADDFQANPLVQLGVQFTGLADALAEYGLTSGSGKLPAWLAVLLGVSVLGYGVYTTRGKYAPDTDSSAAAAGAAGPFGFAGAGTPLQTTDLGYGGSEAGNNV